MRSDPLPDYVFQSVSADLFQAGNLHVLVYADRLSGWVVIHQWRHSPSSRETGRAVTDNFAALGVPERFRSDGGLQFSAKKFRDMLVHWGVEWQPSTPTYAQSNGHAEAAVKAVKLLVHKCAPSGDLSSEEFLQGLLELRNTPDATGFSPAQVLFGHQLRSIVPAHRSAFQPRWTAAMEAETGKPPSMPQPKATTTPAPTPCAHSPPGSSSASRTQPPSYGTASARSSAAAIIATTV